MSYSDNPDSRSHRFNWRRVPSRDSDRRERPTGVTVLAVLNFVSVGLLALALLVAILTPRQALQLTPRPTPLPSSSTSDIDRMMTDMTQLIREEEASGQAARVDAAIAAAAITATLGIPLGLIVGIGLWRLRVWGRKIAVFSYGAVAMLTLLVGYSRPLTGSSLIGILISGAAFIYLLRPEVRATFYDYPS